MRLLPSKETEAVSEKTSERTLGTSAVESWAAMQGGATKQKKRLTRDKDLLNGSREPG